ncbi:MAG: MBL fold metallo-hydrolase [Erysipelotrichaceae bacterium]|nr:MBL fold metallo-hydrolase [Erysipelotrichaceae bacterium]
MKDWEKKRLQYASFQKIDQSQPWFEVYDIGHDIIAIYEPYHFQEVISYLILGQDKALLLDTGLGIGHMRRCVEEIYKGDYLVFNSHHHFDHILGDYLFNDRLYVYDHQEMINALSKPLASDYVKENFAPDQFADEAPIKSHEYVYHPISFQTVEEGHIFNLGRRRLKVIATPGHAKDAIMLVDEENKLLFTGDTYYPAPLYCFEDTFDEYLLTMQKLAKQYKDYLLVTSHNEPYRPGFKLVEVANGFMAIKNKKLLPSKDLGTRELYENEDFSLIKKKEV